MSSLPPFTSTEIIKHLEKLLSNTYILYVKTQGYHWNVEDSRFAMLHALFEEQYQALASAIDDTAERIRQLNKSAANSLKDLLANSTLQEETRKKLSGDDMLQALAHDHGTMVKALHDGIAVSSKTADDATTDFLTERLRAHEKTAWMLNAHLQKNDLQ